MFRNASRLSPVLLLIGMLIWGCVLPRQMYEGERLKRKHVAILDTRCDCGARVIAVDSVRAKQREEGVRPHFKGELAMLPGRHTIEVYFELTRYTRSDRARDIIIRDSDKPMPDMTTFYSINYKQITFDAEAGHTYKLGAESRPLDFPYGAMTWSAWVYEEETGTQIATAIEYEDAE